jgi:hypothetical protein
MASLIFAQQFQKDLDVDGSLKNRAWDFVRKVMTDPTAPGLHIEPINGSRDPRVRTGRVNDNFRAVMFLVREDPEPAYLMAAIKPHNEANTLAKRILLQTNPINGVVEILDEPADVVPAPPPTARPAEEPTGPLVGFKPAELEGVGIAPHIATRATSAATEEQLLTALEGAPPWQADVLLAIATGTPLDEALDAVGATADEAARARAESIEAALEQPGSQMDFVRVDNDEELRRVLEVRSRPGARSSIRHSDATPSGRPTTERSASVAARALGRQSSRSIGLGSSPAGTRLLASSSRPTRRHSRTTSVGTSTRWTRPCRPAVCWDPPAWSSAASTVWPARFSAQWIRKCSRRWNRTCCVPESARSSR